MGIIQLRVWFFCLSVVFSSVSLAYTLEVSEEEIQKRIEAVMPIEKKQLFFTVRLSEPKVELTKGSDRLGLFLNVDVLVPSVAKGAGKGKITGKIRYEKSEGAFYIDEPIIESIEVKRFPAKYTNKMRGLTQTLLAKALSKYPVYQFKDKDIKQKMAKATLKTVEIKDEKLLITLGLF